MLFYFLLLWLIKLELIQTDCNSTLAKCKSFDDLTTTTCSSFNTFKDLNFSCLNISSNTIYLAPKIPSLLGSSFNLTSLKLSTHSLCFSFLNLKGINLNFNPFQTLNLSSNFKLSLEFVESSLNFYLNQSSFLNDTLFSNKFLTLSFSRGIKYTNIISPYLFRNSRIDTFIVTDLKNTFFRKSILRFYAIPNLVLNCSIKKLILSVKSYDLDRVILNEAIFVNLTYLQVIGTLKSIETDLLDSFKQLNFIHIQSSEDRSLFYNIGFKWLQYFNKDLIFDIVYFKLISNSAYTYPDEDFCLFLDIPFENRIFVDFNLIELTCSALWLVNNSFTVKKKINIFLNLQKIIL